MNLNFYIGFWRAATRRLLLVWLLLGLALASYAAPPAYYSVADPDMVTAATATPLNSSVFGSRNLVLPLSGTASAGYRAGVLLANADVLLNLGTLPTVTLRTYLRPAVGAAQLRETRVVRAEVVRAALLGAGSDRPTPLDFVSQLSFNEVEVELGTSLVRYGVLVYYGYALPLNTQTQAIGYLSRFTGDLTTHYSTAGADPGGLVCAGTDVGTPANAVDADLTNFATFSSLATVACPAALRVQLEGPAQAGDYAGFVIGSAGLLDAGLLSGLRVRTYRNGQLQETASGAGVLELNVLPNGQSQVSFPSKLPFDEVSIERVGAVTALDNLRLYYGFGLQPRAFQASNPVLSNFDSAIDRYQVSSDGVLCALCSVINPGAAADGNTGPSSFAQINQPLDALSNLNLKLRLNGQGLAGNRAGLVLRPGAGLLDVAALAQLRINTYAADQTTLLESRTGADLLNVRLLPDGSQEIAFATTRDFDWVELSVAPGAAAFANTRVYYAFADDRPLVLPQLVVAPPVPLPVQLTAFSAKWVAGAAELSWRTAAERNSRHFVVERAVAAARADGSTPTLVYRAVGQVAAAGSSTAALTYQLTDHTPAVENAPRYYRLRQVDLDGHEHLSAVVVLAPAARPSAVLGLYPNPASAAGGGSTVVLGALAAPGQQVQVYSALGQLLRQQPASQTQIAVAGWPAGLYEVVLLDAAGHRQASQRLVVQ